MLSEIPYATLANFSPRGTAEISQSSRSICGAIKAGRISAIESALPHLRHRNARALAPFLGPGVTLVPVPRSAPLVEGAIWPPYLIANILVANGLGGSVLPCLKRITAVPKSSSSPTSERPLIHEHYDSLTVEDQLLRPDQITIVDDVLTMGRTMFACAQRLREAFPDAQIRAFAMVRTQGRVDDIEKIVDPDVGTIKGYRSGKAFRDP